MYIDDEDDNYQIFTEQCKGPNVKERAEKKLKREGKIT